MQKPRNRLSTVACRGKIKCFRSDPRKLPWRSGSLFIERYEGKWTLTLDYDIRQSITQKCYELSPDTIKTVYCFTQLRLTLDFGKNSLLYFHLIPMKSVEEEKMKNVYEKLLEIQKRNPVPTIIENMSDSEDDSFNEYEIAPTQCKVLPGRISPRQQKVTSMPGRTSPMEITLNQNQDKEALEHVEISPSEMEIAADTETSYIPTCQNLISTDTDSSSKVTQTTQLKCSGKMKLTGEELSLPKWRDGTLRMKCVNGSWDMDLDYYVIGGGMITINYNISTGVIIKVICKSQLILQLKPADSLPVTVRLKPHTLNDRNNIRKMFHKLLEIQRTTEKGNQPVISNKRSVSNLSHQEFRDNTSGKRMKTLPDSSEGLTVIQTGATMNEELIRVLERAATKPTIIQACSQNTQDLNEEDMKNIADLCRSCKHDKMLVTHGTAKVATFAEFLAKQDLHKTILLTADNLELEVDFNVGFTLGVLQCLSDRDIYIIRDGKLIHWSKVSHDAA